MISLFGCNILTNKELEKIRKEPWEKTKKYLKIKELWRVYTSYDEKPKCPYCNEKRLISIPLPDGSTAWVTCSCAKSITSFKIEREDRFCIVNKYGDSSIYIGSDYDWKMDDRIIFNESELESVSKSRNGLNYCYFTSKKLAEKAKKILEKKEKEKNHGK